MNKFYCDDPNLMPRRGTKFSAGYDFIAPEKIVIRPHSVSDVIDSKVSIKLDTNKVLMCYVRSSFGFKHSVTLVNNTGIIDADFYPNTIKCKLRNDSDDFFVIEKGDKYMQGIIMNYSIAEDEIEPEAERLAGIGSTGK